MRSRVAHVISFRTAKFDVSAETPNPINSIAGKSVLEWLRTELENAGHRSTAPEAEDWGWYIDVDAGGSSYLVGASGDADATTAEIEWTLQVHKVRSFKDRLLRRNTMHPDEPVTALIERALRADPRIGHVSVERERDA